MVWAGRRRHGTLIAAPSSTKNQDGQRDPEMHSTKKGNNYHFGMKAHIGVDAHSGLVHTVTTTAANAHDVTRKAGIRAKVEHPFQVIKCQWGYRKTRYRGLYKNTQQIITLFALHNLFKVRRHLMPICTPRPCCVQS